MADLGLYNFVKHSLEQGKSKEEITQALLNNKINQLAIDETFKSVETNTPPAVMKPPLETASPPQRNTVITTYDITRPTFLTVLCGYYFVTWILALVHGLVLTILVSVQAGFPLLSTFNIKSLDTVAIAGILIAVCLFMGVLGIWFMKRWGVILYSLSIIGTIGLILNGLHGFSHISQLLTLNFILSFLTTLLLPIAMIAAGITYFRRMS